MKTPRISRSILLAASAFCALGLSNIALAQPQAPDNGAAPAKAKRAGKGAGAGKGKRAKGGKKGPGKNLMPRVVTATETAMGKPMTPELKEQITTAMQQRDAAVKAANDAYYAAFATATGLTADQVKDINRPARGGAKPAETDKPAAQNDMNAPADEN